MPSPFASERNRPVIIGGCPRSGTTLLRTMLHCHPELAIPRETRFVLEAWLRRKRFGDLRDEGNRRRVARWIFERKESQASRLGLDADTAIERLVASPPTLGSLLATCFVMYAERRQKPRWGDKRPLYAARMNAVWDLFPSAQFIHVVRDPRACVASLRKLGWYGGKAAPALELWERSMEVVNAWRPKLAGDQLLEVRYEDLVSEPEETLTRVAEFAGLAADDDALNDMLAYHQLEETRSERYHANVSRSLDPARMSGWKEALDEGEVAFVEEVAAAPMRQWGYEAVADGVSAPADLLRELRERRRRRAAARRKLAWSDRLQKLVTHRHPLAAEPRRGSAGEPGVG